jgi:hypothetical protein
VRRGAGLLAVLAAACGPESVPFHIEFQLERDPEMPHVCATNSCATVPMGCDAAVLVRVVDAAAPRTVYARDCFRVQTDGTLCAIGDLDLGGRRIPNKPVQIQVAVWPDVPPFETCPDVTYDLLGKFSSSSGLSPALAGASYFEVGSAPAAPVTLGCIDTRRLSAEVCSASGSVEVRATVTELESRLTVTQATAQGLVVSMGEPEPVAGTADWAMRDDLQRFAALDIINAVPTWRGVRENGFVRAACIQVIGQQLQSAASILCVPTSEIADGRLDASGVLVEDATLDRIEEAIGALPASGVVLGFVVGPDNALAAGVRVTPSSGTVLYLSEDLTSTNTVATTASGAFVSLDAPFGGAAGLTTWTASDGVVESVGTVIGGVVRNQVTVIALRLAGEEDP